MRNLQISVDEYYHIYNRGNNKQNIFLNDKDRIRFLFLIIYFQSPLIFQNTHRYIHDFIDNGNFGVDDVDKKEIIKHKYVELVSFTLMPNHFHLILKEMEEGGISKYMHRILTAYTMYFNTKYERSGHLFQGTFKAVHVDDNNQLLHLSAYIHRNPRELKGWKNKESKYPWSSYCDYIRENRWNDLLCSQVILEQFKCKKEYDNFVRTNIAKSNKPID